MSNIDHIFLYCLFFFIFYFFSKNADRTNSWYSFIKKAWLPILFFTLIEGCRYGRGNDYLFYKYRYEYISALNEPQILFLYLMRFLHSLNFNYIGAFIAYAFLFIAGAFYFVRTSFTRKEAQWMYLFIPLSMLLKMEFMIRQYVAMPFIFCAIAMMFKRRWLIGVVCLLIAYFIHSGTLVAIPILLLFYFFLKKIIPYKYSIFLLFLVYYVIPTGLLTDLFISILNSLHLDSIIISEQFGHYIENSDRWLGEDSILEEAKQSNLTKTLQFLFESSIIVAGYLALKIRPNLKVLCLYNIAILGFLLTRLFYGQEIIVRMTGQLYIYWFVPAGYAIYVYNSIAPKNILYKISLWVMIIYLFSYWSRFVFLNPEAIFFWDK